MKDKNLQIIDIERKGNVVRFYLGKNGSQWGDDWDDAPYEHNAGVVYPEFVEKTIDIAFDFDALVLEPCHGWINSQYSKEDMMIRSVPCLIVVPHDIVGNDYWHDSFDYWLAKNRSLKFYFGDEFSSKGLRTVLKEINFKTKKSPET